jgi:hypothetical protein
MAPRLPRPLTGEPTLDKALAVLQAAVEPYIAKAFLRSTTLSRVSLTTAGVALNHTLQREPVGWLVTRTTGAGATVYETARDTLTLTLVASAACVVDLEVW